MPPSSSLRPPGNMYARSNLQPTWRRSAYRLQELLLPHCHPPKGLDRWWPRRTVLSTGSLDHTVGQDRTPRFIMSHNASNVLVKRKGRSKYQDSALRLG